MLNGFGYAIFGVPARDLESTWRRPEDLEANNSDDSDALLVQGVSTVSAVSVVYQVTLWRVLCCAVIWCAAWDSSSSSFASSFVFFTSLISVFYLFLATAGGVSAFLYLCLFHKKVDKFNSFFFLYFLF